MNKRMDRFELLFGQVAGDTKEEQAAEARAAILLWSAAEAFGRRTGLNELVFADITMRLLAGTMAKLDHEAALAYLAALKERLHQQYLRHPDDRAEGFAVEQIRGYGRIERLA